MVDIKSIGLAAGTVALGAGKAVAQVAATTGETAMSVVNILSKRAQSNPRRTGAVAGAGAALALVGGVATGVALTRGRDYHRVGRTDSGAAVVFNVKDSAGMPVRVLRAGGVYQSATYLDEDTKYLLPFSYYRAFDVVFQEGIKHDRLLMLGGGGCTFAKHVLAEDNTTCIDVVEPDAAMTSIAREYFFLDDAISQFDADGKRLHVINAEGSQYLRRRAELVIAKEESHGSGVIKIVDAVTNAAKQFATSKNPDEVVSVYYDAIINDAFEGKTPCAALLTPEALADAKTCLNEGGLYLINIADPGKNDAFLHTVMARLSQVFTAVHAIPCPDLQFGAKDCCLLVATDGEYCFANETQVQMSCLPDEDDDENDEDGDKGEDEEPAA